MNKTEQLPIPHTMNRRIKRALDHVIDHHPGTPDRLSTVARLFTHTERHLRRFAAWTADPRRFPD